MPRFCLTITASMLLWGVGCGGGSMPDANLPPDARADANLPELYTPCTDVAQCPGEVPACLDGFCTWMCEATEDDPYGFFACDQPYTGPGQAACVSGIGCCVVVCGDLDPAWCPDGNCDDCPAGTVCTHFDYAPVDFCAAPSH